MIMKRRDLLTPFILATLLALPPGPVEAQSAAEVMQRALAAQAERLAGVDNVTITQDVMGMQVGMYMEKKDVGGVPTLVPVSTVMGGQVTPIPQDQTSADWSNPFREDWAGRTRLVGTDQVDGKDVTVLVIEDFTGLAIPEIPGNQAGRGQIEPTLMRFFMDEDQMVMRKMEMEAEMTQEDGTVSPIQMTLFLEDYRDVDGFLYPFRTRTIAGGMFEAADVDQEELRQQLAEMRKQLDDMPQAQRAMMEQMMGPQIEKLEEMLGGSEGGMEVVLTVTDLKVNSGPPGGGLTS
jgi:hypothetical protein